MSRQNLWHDFIPERGGLATGRRDECGGARAQPCTRFSEAPGRLIVAHDCHPQDEQTHRGEEDPMEEGDLPKPEEIEVETHDIYRHDDNQAFVTLMSVQVKPLNFACEENYTVRLCKEIVAHHYPDVRRLPACLRPSAHLLTRSCGASTKLRTPPLTMEKH